MEKTREELVRELQESIKNTPNGEFMTEIAIPGVVNPVSQTNQENDK